MSGSRLLAALAALARRRTWRSIAAALVAALVAPLAAAQDYPSRPVRIIVPFAAGGPADVYARFVAQRLQESMGQTFVVDNRPGAGSIIGTDAVAKSAPDGYTLLLMSNTHTVNESLIPTKPFQLHARLRADRADQLVRPGAGRAQPACRRRRSAELIKAAKAKPGGLSYASSGPGTPYHMAGELFKAMAGVSIVHIPYKGSSGARTDVLGGQVDMMFDAVPTMTEHITRRQGEGARHDRHGALGGDARRADDRRGRRAGLRGDDLARPDGAEGHAAGGRRRGSTPRSSRIVGQPETAQGLEGAGRDADDDERRRVRRATSATTSPSGRTSSRSRARRPSSERHGAARRRMAQPERCSAPAPSRASSLALQGGFEAATGAASRRASAPSAR